MREGFESECFVCNPRVVRALEPSSHVLFEFQKIGVENSLKSRLLVGCLTWGYDFQG
jgi:hypothetical protein